MTLRVLVLPADAGACGHYRTAWPAECAGRDPELRVEVRPEGFQVTKDHQGRVVDVHVSMSDGKAPDVLVTQRPLHRDWTFAIPALQRRGVRVVVDVDDDFRTVHRANKAWAQVQPHLNADHNWEWLERACAAADLVTVTTPALAGRYGAHGRVRVLPNYVPAALLAEPRPPHDGVVVGWPGTMAVHPADLQTTRGAVGRALRRTGATFRVIGDGKGVQQALGLGHQPEVTGMLPLASYLRALPSLDVVIVPLEDSAFNGGKCVDAGTRIATERGLITAREIEVGDRVWADGHWRSVLATEHDVPRPGYELVTKRGRSLRLTPEHRLWSPGLGGGWVEARHMTVGMPLATTAEAVGAPPLVSAPWPSDGRASRKNGLDPMWFVSAPEVPHVTITPRWGRVLGLYAGDGSASQTSVCFSCDGQDQDLIDLLSDDLRQMGLFPSTEYVRTWGGEVIRRRSVKASSTHLLRFMRSVGLVDVNTRVIRVPEVIWRSPREVVAAFLAGIFEADGTCGQTRLMNVSLTTKHLVFARELQHLLGCFGIDSAVQLNMASAGVGLPKYPYWNVVLSRAGSDVFAKEIGFLSERKKANLERLTSRPHGNAYQPMRWTDEVVEMRPCWVDPVDIEVEGSVFAAAGFVSHNSCLKAMEAAGAGCAVVMAPTPDNVRLHEAGIGVLARTPKEWEAELVRLIEDHDARLAQQEANRAVMGGFTIEGHAGEWAEAWRSVVPAPRSALQPVG